MTEASESWPDIFDTFARADRNISPSQVTWAMTEILEERSTDAQTAAFMLGLRIRGESAQVVSALVQVMMDHAHTVPVTHGHEVVLDIVGTGGDGSHSVNISTMAAVVAAACGAAVIKHGNRAVSSSTGAADLLEELGVVIDLDAYKVAEVAQQIGIAFCFAPQHHPAMRFAAAARKQLGIHTVFNILGPLTNPALAQAALIGCANLDMAPIMARVLLARKVRALVVRCDDGFDEISLAQPTRVWDVTSGVLRESVLSPQDFGVSNFNPELLRGGDKRRNAELTRMVLGDPNTNGQNSGSAHEKTDDGKNETETNDSDRVSAIRLSVAVNAAAALAAVEAVTFPERAASMSLVERINHFLPTTTKVLENQSAWRLMLRWIDVSRSV